MPTDISETIQTLVSNVTLQVADDIDTFVSPLIPENLSPERWESLMDDFIDDIQEMIERRIQWLLQSAHAEVREIQLEQLLQQKLLQARIQTAAEQAIIIQAQERLRQSEALGVGQASPINPKVIPDPKPKELKAIPNRQSVSVDDSIPITRPYAPRQLELQPEPYAPPDQAPEVEAAPRRRRRRSGVWQSA